MNTLYTLQLQLFQKVHQSTNHLMLKKKKETTTKKQKLCRSQWSIQQNAGFILSIRPCCSSQCCLLCTGNNNDDGHLLPVHNMSQWSIQQNAGFILSIRPCCSSQCCLLCTGNNNNHGHLPPVHNILPPPPHFSLATQQMVGYYSGYGMLLVVSPDM